MADFVGAIDQGTTSTRFMIFDHGGNEVARHQLEHEQILPQAGLGRARPGRDLGAHQRGDPDRARRRPACTPRDLAALGITNQRETTVVWNRKTGRPVLQRDRLAGHPHRPDRRGAGARRARRRDPAQGRPAAGDVLLRRQDPVDPRERRRRARGRRDGRRDVRQHRLAGCCGTSPAARDGGVHVTDVDQRQPHHADEPRDPRLGRRAAGVLRHPARDAARDPAVLATRTATARRSRTARSAARSRSPATSATSRRPRSARSASPPARPRTPTAPATSCCSTPAPSWCARKNGLLTTVCYQFGDERRRSTRWRARSRSPARRCSGCATSSASSPAPSQSEALARQVDGQRRRVLRAGVLRAVRAVLALRRPRRDRRAVPVQHQRPPGPGHPGGDLLPEPRRRRGDGAGLRRAARGAQGRRRRDRQRRCACRSRPTSSACRSAGRWSPRRPRSARRTPPGWPSASGRTPTSCAQNWNEAKRWEPAVVRRAARRRATPAGRRPSSARWTGSTSTDVHAHQPARPIAAGRTPDDGIARCPPTARATALAR